MPRLRKGEGTIVHAEGDLASLLKAQGFVVVRDQGPRASKTPRTSEPDTTAAEEAVTAKEPPPKRAGKT